jgi:DNA-binding CsgD family transcriptional regulator
VAVLGDGCELRHAAELADVDHATALTAVPALIAAGVFADRVPLAFEHPLIRSAVYSDVPAPVRAAEHGRAAALLRHDGAGSEAVARHILKAERVGEPWAEEALSDAARRALARGTPESAAAFLRRALGERLDERRRGEVLRGLGDALARLGDPAALEVLEGALALAPSQEARMEIAEASVDPLLANGRAAEARSLLELVLGDSEPGDPEQTLLLSAHLTGVYALSGLVAGDASAGLRRIQLDASTQPRRYAGAVLALWEALFDGTAARVLELGRLATSSHTADAREGRTMHFVLVALALAGDTEHALLRSGNAIETSRVRGSLMGQGVGLGWRSLIQLLAGNVGDAETDARAALGVLADTQLSAPTVGATAVLAWALVERGELADAEAVLAGAPAGLGWAGAALRCSRARLLIAAHRNADALAVLASVEDDCARVGWRSSGPVSWRSLTAFARLGVGDAIAARRLAEEEAADAERFGCGRELARARRILGVVQGQLPILVSAVQVAREADAPLELAQALVEQGAAQRRAGDRAAAKTPLFEGMELAARCSATALVERAGIELRAAGARPRRIARRGVDALTPSERRVATLAADGLSNAEVAQALFVTVRTIEMHLSATYRKLAIASRSQLPAALADNAQA